MGAFDWFKSDAPATDEHAEILGADSASSPAAASGVAAHAVDSARQAANAALESAPRRRGRPPKNAQGSEPNQRASTASNGSASLPPELRAEIERHLEACYDPKAWGALLSAPADAALVITGRERWKVSNEERATAGACGSAFARTLMITNPRLLAGFMLGSALFSMYIPRLTLDLKDMVDSRRAKEEKKRRDPAA